MAAVHHPPTLAGIAAMMGETSDPFVGEVGGLLAYIATQHEPPVTCHECAQFDDPCLMLDTAHAVGIAWLMAQVNR